MSIFLPFVHCFMLLFHPLWLHKPTTGGVCVCVCDTRMNRLPQRRCLCCLTRLLYVMCATPLVAAAALRMAAWTYWISPAFRSFNENLTFSQTLYQRLCMQMEIWPVHHLSSQALPQPPPRCSSFHLNITHMFVLNLGSGQFHIVSPFTCAVI